MDNHTPGPWSIKGAVFATITGTQTHVGYNGRILVYQAEVAKIQPRHEREANAHLISAAPELLEACERLALFHESCGHEGNADSAIEAAKAAIAKAEGGT